VVNQLIKRLAPVEIIDISGVDWAYKSSTCDVMYCRQFRHLQYIMVIKFRILFAPLHRSSPFIGGLRCQAIQTEHGPYIAERTKKAVYIVRCLWLKLHMFKNCTYN
jgi:hypothetical protein